MAAPVWHVENRLLDLVRVAWISMCGISVLSESEELGADLDRRGHELRDIYRDPASALPAFAPARRLYHDLGIDPSKHRPASEALVRRILQGKEFPRVNTAVDAANLASINCMRPVGLYDAARIEGFPWDAGGDAQAGLSILLRRGTTGEAYHGIGKEVVHLDGRPALFDRQGPFGNPSSDSDRTKVTLETRELLFVLFEPAGESRSATEEHLRLSREILLRLLGGEAGWRIENGNGS